MTPTFLPLVILAVVAPIGAFDALYFHVYRLRLFARPASRAETATHVARSLIVGVAALLLARYEPRGAWFFTLGALFALDFANNLLDVLLEPASRADLGGLPPMEYAIHVIGATASGAITGVFLAVGWPLARLPTALAPAALPAWLSLDATLVGVGGVALALLETVLLLRAAGRERRAA
ncbi:MAG: hypothetical protein U0325_32760 [Polyangiales bacterium]